MRSLLAGDFAPGQLPAGAQGPKGEKGDRGERGEQGEQGVQGLAGATNVVVRWSGQGMAQGGLAANGDFGGIGSAANCEGPGCIALGGAGGDSNGSNQGGVGGAAFCDGVDCFALGGDGGRGDPVGTGGNAVCQGTGCFAQGGADGSGTATLAQPGEGATVGERAECEPGERAVGGGYSGFAREAMVVENHPVALDASDVGASDPPADGEAADAWWVVVYNQSKVGENRDPDAVVVRAYVLCASP